VALVGIAVHALGGDAAAAGGVATRLDPEVERRFAAAQAAAAAEGVPLTMTSGWRSAAEQQDLVDDAVERYGSLEEARRWVLPPETSAHVDGTAVDVGPTDGALWLGEHGFEHGLCRTYANEIWHFELLADGADRCPDLQADSSSGW
ncbi:M15 family metallopeptidase, partial [uncultured Cellulomonas sp.]|uniref:M15 family metallopeptidase n=1 Tax=uncultured Cellulomonas sp. TaxID=189682 RepID=UPI0028E7C615